MRDLRHRRKPVWHAPRLVNNHTYSDGLGVHFWGRPIQEAKKKNATRPGQITEFSTRRRSLAKSTATIAEWPAKPSAAQLSRSGEAISRGGAIMVRARNRGHERLGFCSGRSGFPAGRATRAKRRLAARSAGPTISPAAPSGTSARLL